MKLENPSFLAPTMFGERRPVQLKLALKCPTSFKNADFDRFSFAVFKP